MNRKQRCAMRARTRRRMSPINSAFDGIGCGDDNKWWS